MGLLAKLTKTPLDICEEHYSRFKNHSPVNYFHNMFMYKDANDFERAFTRLNPEQMNSRFQLLESLLSDYSASAGSYGITMLTYKLDDVTRQARFQRVYSYLDSRNPYSADDIDAGYMACITRYQQREYLHGDLKLFYAMKITDLIPLSLLEEVGQELMKRGERMTAFNLYMDLIKMKITDEGRNYYYVGKLVFEMSPDSEKMVNHAKDYLERASKAGVREADVLMIDVLQKLLEFNKQKQAAYEAINEEEIGRLKRLLADADARYPETKNQNLYYRICCYGFEGHAAKAERDLIIEAVRKYNAGVDYKVDNHLVTKDSISLLYNHAKVNTMMAQEGVIEFMDRAGDAFRDGYGDVRQNLPAARACYELSAESGNQHSQLYYGIFCKEGIGGPVDYAAAVKNLNEAGKGHHNLEAGRAFYNLGKMIEKGQGIEQNAEQAELVLEAANKLGWNDDVQKWFESVCEMALIKKTEREELGADAHIVYPDDEDAVWLPPLM